MLFRINIARDNIELITLIEDWIKKTVSFFLYKLNIYIFSQEISTTIVNSKIILS
jgi:hypothetical protein